MLFLEPLGELLDGNGAPIGITPGGWIVAVLGRGNDGDRPAVIENTKENENVRIAAQRLGIHS